MAIPVLRFKAGTALPKPDRQALIVLSAHAEIEVYPGTHHGFAFPKRPVYNRDCGGTALGTAAGAVSPQSPGLSCKGLDALSHHRLSGIQSHRDLDRPDRDPLVRARLYRRHRAGLDLRARADQEREAVGRSGADHAAAARRFYSLGHHRHHPRRPHRLRAVLQSAVLLQPSRRDPRAVAGRHVVPWRLSRLRRRGDPVQPQEQHLDPVARRHHHRGRADRTVPRAARQFRQRRTLGPAGRSQPALGDDVSRPAARCRAIRASFTRPGSRASCCSPCWR